MPKQSSDKAEEALFRRMQKSDSVNSKAAAIAVAKDKGMVKQDGESLALTDKGRKAAKKARKK